MHSRKPPLPWGFYAENHYFFALRKPPRVPIVDIFQTLNCCKFMITRDLKGKPHNAKKQVSFSSLPYRPIFVTLLIRSTMEMAHTKRVLLSPKIFMNWLQSNFCLSSRLHKNAGIFWCLLVRREVNPKVMIIIIFIVFHATIYAATSSIC